MEKQSGLMLSGVWDDMGGKQKAQILKQIVDMECVLSATKFTKLGSLYYKHDLPSLSSNNSGPLYVDKDGQEVRSEYFGIGPINHRSFFDFGKGRLDIDRGPCESLTPLFSFSPFLSLFADPRFKGYTLKNYLKAIAHREIACVDAGLKYPVIPEGLFYGPRQYQPSPPRKLSALQNYLKVAPYVLPEDEVTHSSVLWHNDLHLQNIFVDPGDPTRISGVIDWQSTSACPLFMQAARPGFLDYDGPVPEELGLVSLPSNIDTMPEDERQKAKKLHQAQTLHNLYLALTRRANAVAFQAIQNQATLRHQISVTPGLILADYEPYLHNILRDVAKEWPDIVGKDENDIPLVPCPLLFSAAEVKDQEREEDLWAQGVELMNEFIRDTGCFKHWDGRVSTADYELSKKQLDEGVRRFLNREARNECERTEWLKALPFVDYEYESHEQ